MTRYHYNWRAKTNHVNDHFQGNRKANELANHVVSLLTDVSYLRLISSHCGDVILLRFVLVVFENWFLYYHR